MHKIPCSVPILTLNSAKYLRRCLESVKDFADVYLVDGNSTDETRAIAQEYGIPIYKQAETDEPNVRIADFTAVRKRALTFVKEDWILFLDSDEYLIAELVEEIRSTLVKAPDSKKAWYIQKKYCIGDRRFDFAFNYPNYYMRLYHRESGVRFKDGKIVHEQMHVPQEVDAHHMQGWVYSEVSPTFVACVKKDRFQLGLMKQGVFSKPSFRSRPHSVKMAIIYFLRAGNIAFKSLRVYATYGYAHSLPVAQWMRHVRVHLFMSYWRLVQAILGKKSYEQAG